MAHIPEEIHESEVRSYCRNFPAVFTTADGCTITDEQGRSYLDFLAGASTLNYGHNNPVIVEPVQNYLMSKGVTHSLDMFTAAKLDFIRTFQSVILEPRKMPYKMMFPGPTGTNAIEAAMKLARKVTGRSNVVAFSGGFHGMTLGSLSATASKPKRAASGQSLSDVTHMPYDGFLGPDIDTMDVIERQLRSSGSGIDPVAAILVETVQGEGGLNVASPEWLCRLSALAKEIGALLIIDDIQAGIGRAGTFFSFENMNFSPDIVVLSKSLSGYGSPFSLVLLKPEIDVWKPGEHNGTFRGNNLAFVGATAAIRGFWQDQSFQNSIKRRASQVRDSLESTARSFPEVIVRTKGRGLFAGLEFRVPEQAGLAANRLFDRRIIIETSGPSDEVLKVLPPLTIKRDELARGLDEIALAIEALATPRGTRRKSTNSMPITPSQARVKSPLSDGAGPDP